MDDPSVLPRRIELDGEYDLTRKQEVGMLLSSLDPDGPLEIDLTRVSYFDSTVLHELAALRLRCKGSAITLTGANANIRRILHLAGFDELFTIVEG